MNLTQRTVDALKPSAAEQFIWDDNLPGFGIRLKPSGKASYLVQYRIGRRTRRTVIGSTRTYKLEKARDKGQRMLVAARDGVDHSAIKRAGRQAETIKELAERYLTEYAAERKKASSVATDQRNIRNHIVPLLGTLPVRDATRADIESFMRKVRAGATAREEKLPRTLRRVRGGPGSANRCYALLSKMFNLAERWGLRADGTNPCRHVEKNRERRVERFLSAEELARLGEVLSEAENAKMELPGTVTAIRLLLFTGARLGEVLGLRWEHVDAQHGLLRLPDSKTGAKVIYLGAPALSLLTALRSDEDTNAWVCQGAALDGETRPLVNLEKPWRRIRAQATVLLWAKHPSKAVRGLVERLTKQLGREPTAKECLRAAAEAKLELPKGLLDVRLHDLRHSFASVGAAGGLSLPMIGALLGHRQAATTLRYAHLSADPMRAAADAIGERIAAAMRGTSAEVAMLREYRA
ncbi:MAG TPA: tyrosine-type recombinase/integrase [Stellaceae bacterium]|nr:tyrosine-type recombinase/integrase [Stellaceae bacterium]